jgi:hypothetical protein
MPADSDQFAAAGNSIPNIDAIQAISTRRDFGRETLNHYEK